MSSISSYLSREPSIPQLKKIIVHAVNFFYYSYVIAKKKEAAKKEVIELLDDTDGDDAHEKGIEEEKVKENKKSFVENFLCKLFKNSSS